MRDDVVVASTPMSDFFRNSTPQQKRAAYALAADKAIESQKRTIESVKAIKKSKKQGFNVIFVSESPALVLGFLHLDATQSFDVQVSF